MRGLAPTRWVEVQEKYRFSIGVFNDHERLRSALDDLGANGWSVGQLCLTGLPSTINAISTSDARLTSMLAQFEARHKADGPNIIASSGPVLQAISQPPSHYDGHLGPYVFYLPSHLSGRLVRRIDAGAIVLFVSSTSASQQDQSTRILLRHATLDIMTHEFTPSPGYGAP